MYFCVLTRLWPAGSEEDWTASGSCELVDLECRPRSTAKEEKSRNHFKHDGKYCHKKIICLCVCVPVRCPLIILSWELKSCLYFSLDDWGTAQSDKSWTLQWEREKDNGSHLPHLSGHQQANWCKHLKLPSSIQGWPLLQFSTWTIKWSLVDRRSWERWKRTL